jgi:hypothetical protein
MVARHEKLDRLGAGELPEKSPKSAAEGALNPPVAGGVPVELKKMPCVAAVGSGKPVSKAGVWVISAHGAGAVDFVNSELFPNPSVLRVALPAKSSVLLELRGLSLIRMTVVWTARLLFDRGTGASLSVYSARAARLKKHCEKSQ